MIHPKGNYKKLIYILPFLSIGIFYWMIFRYSMNIPYYDDYDLFLDFINRFFESEDWNSRLSLIFSHQNEHRFPVTRIFTILSYYALGQVNLKFIIIFSSLSLILLLFLFYRIFQKKEDKFLYFIPVILFLFQLQYWQSLYWASSPIQNFGVLLFSLITLRFIIRTRSIDFLMAIFFALLAVGSMANGLLILFVGLGILIYLKRWNHFFIWIILTLVVFILYGGQDYLSGNVRQSIFQNTIRTIHFFLIFLGASMHLANLLALLAGCIALIYFFYSCHQKYYRENLVFFSFYAFLLLSGILVSFHRSFFGIEYALQSRYRIFSIMIFILIYLTFVERSNPLTLKKYFPYILVFSIIFNIVSIQAGFKKLDIYRRFLLVGFSNWQSGEKGLHYPTSEENAEEIIKKSIEKGYYIPPQYNLLAEFESKKKR